MTLNEKIKTAVAVGIAAAAVVDTVKTTRRERKRRAEIAVEFNKQIDAIARASKVVSERANAGSYASLEDVKTDFEFEIIAARYEK